RLVQLGGQPLQLGLGVQPQTLVRPGRDEQRRRLPQQLADALRQRQPLLLVQRAGVSAGQQHLNSPPTPTRTHSSPQLYPTGGANQEVGRTVRRTPANLSAGTTGTE